MFRKLVTTLTIAALIISTILPVQLFAAGDISAEGRICRDLGILKGDTGVVDGAYLETRPSRLQAAIMYLRLKGLEQQALSYTGASSFKDAGTVSWKEGRNVLSYLKDHPEHGWIGDGVNFLPKNYIDSKAYYKVLLESLGYKQRVDGDGDFSWDSVLEFAAGKGLKKVAEEKSFTVNSLAIATVEALTVKMKNSDRKLIEHLVDKGAVAEANAVATGLFREGIEAAVKTVRAISNSKVEVVFEEAVGGQKADDTDLYDISQLDIKDVSVKNPYSVIIDTSAMSDSTTYALTFNDKSYSFRGVKKDNTAPKLVTGECKDTELLELCFDRVLDNKTAQDTATYSISGVEIKSAALDSTNTKVRIVTNGIQVSRSYELKIQNMKNGDGVSTKLITKRFTGKKDTNAPKLDKLTVLNNIRLRLEFSDINGLNKATAEEKDNYNITSGSGDLEIEAVTVKDNDDDGLWETVELATESQDVGKSYTLKIANIADNSVIGNTIAREIKKDFRGKAKDTSAPSVDHNPKAVTNNIIEVVFKETNALDIESACDEDNYEIDNDLEIKEIRIKDPEDLYSTGGRTVYLITSEMEKSEYYTLIIKGVTDEFGNELKSSSGGYKKYKFRGMAEDNTPPYVTFVECIDNKTIEINFDNTLDEKSAENIVNYRVDGLALVTKAILQEDEKTVRLTVSSLSSDKNHTIHMSNIEDMSGNSISGLNVSVVYNGNINDTDAPEVDYIEAMNEYEVWVHFDEAVSSHSAQMKASGISFNQSGYVLDDGTTVVMKASAKMDDNKYEVTSLTGVRDLRSNAYVFEHDLDFYGADMENDPPEVECWEQLDVARFRVIFSEPVLLTGDGVSGIKNPSGVSLGWKAVLNPKEEDSNEAYSTVDYIASKEIPGGKEYKFNFTAMVSDYMGKGAYDENDNGGSANSTILEAYMEDDEDPVIEYVEAITRTKAQVVFNEPVKQPGSYKITYRDEDDRLKTVLITRTEVDSKDENRVNIFTSDEMSQEYSYTLIPVAAASDIAGNKLDTHDVEIYFEGSNIISKDYIQGVEFVEAHYLKVSKSGKIYEVTSLYELDANGNILGGNLIDGDSVRVSDNVHRIKSKKPLLKDVRYKITVDGLEYRFYGGVQNGDISLELSEREISFDGMDTDDYDVMVFAEDYDELDVDEVHGKFVIDPSERLRNGDRIYIYVEREVDNIIIYGVRVVIGGMSEASSSKQITGFSITDTSPDVLGNIDEANGIITASVPYGTDVDSLTAAFSCSAGATVKVGSIVQKSGQTVNDFSNEVTYTVTAEDGSAKYYRVRVSVNTSTYEKRIRSFKVDISGTEAVGSIDETNHVITLELPGGTEVKALRPMIQTSSGTEIKPASGAIQDFSSPVVYKVIAEDGSVQNYTVIANVALSQANYITDFYFPGISTGDKVTIDNTRGVIDMAVPFGTDLTHLKAAFKSSAGSVVKIGDTRQISGETVNDFSRTVIYTVTAENKAVREYAVKVSVGQNTEKKLLEFGFEMPRVQGVIDEVSGVVNVTVPRDSNINELIAVFRCSANCIVKVGDAIQINGETKNNFTNPVIYTIMAEDGSFRQYTIRVNHAYGSDIETKVMVAFKLRTHRIAVKAVIDEANHRITAEFPKGTDITKLTAVFSYLGKSVYVGNVNQISGITVNDFSKEVIYRVITEDGTAVEYKVIVTVSKSKA